MTLGVIRKTKRIPRLIISAVVVLFIGCGYYNDGDCRNKKMACLTGSICVKLMVYEDYKYECRSIGECVGMPAEQEVPFLETTKGRTIHWTTIEDCIGISYSTEVESAYEFIEDSLNKWESINCSRICFGVPYVSEIMPDPEKWEKRIHIYMGKDDDSSIVACNIAYDRFTGKISSAVIRIGKTYLQEISYADTIYLLGCALGLGDVEKGADSVMSFPHSRQETTEMDREALCVLYGEKPYCNEQ